MLPLHASDVASTRSPVKQYLSKRCMIISIVLIVAFFLLYLFGVGQSFMPSTISISENGTPSISITRPSIENPNPTSPKLKHPSLDIEHPIFKVPYSNGNRDEVLNNNFLDVPIITNPKGNLGGTVLENGDTVNVDINDASNLQEQKQKNQPTHIDAPIHSEFQSPLAPVDTYTITRPSQKLENPNGRYITFVISTVSRSTNYLKDTLEALLLQLPPPSLVHNPFVNTVNIIVVNNNPIHQIHENVESIKKICIESQTEFAKKCRHYTTFTELGKRKIIVKNTNNYQGKVKQQTADFSKVLELISENLEYYPSQYVVIMEDDWILCENAWISLQYLLNKVETQFSLSTWIALRFSYGLNGILLQGSDIPALRDHFKRNISSTRPPDHLIYDFMKDHHEKNRKIIVYRHNLYNHIGEVSSLTQRKRANPGCYGYMYDWLQPLEIYNNKACPFDDISPCPRHSKESKLVDWDMSPFETHRKHYPFCDAGIKNDDIALQKACRIRKK